MALSKNKGLTLKVREVDGPGGECPAMAQVKQMVPSVLEGWCRPAFLEHMVLCGKGVAKTR